MNNVVKFLEDIGSVEIEVKVKEILKDAIAEV